MNADLQRTMRHTEEIVSSLLANILQLDDAAAAEDDALPLQQQQQQQKSIVAQVIAVGRQQRAFDHANALGTCMRRRAQ